MEEQNVEQQPDACPQVVASAHGRQVPFDPAQTLPYNLVAGHRSATPPAGNGLSSFERKECRISPGA
jgi:hypothetical protein